MYGKIVHGAIAKADDLIDQVTADIFTQISREVDKYLGSKRPISKRLAKCVVLMCNNIFTQIGKFRSFYST